MICISHPKLNSRQKYNTFQRCVFMDFILFFQIPDIYRYMNVVTWVGFLMLLWFLLGSMGQSCMETVH